MVKNSILMLLISMMNFGFVQNDIIRELDGVWYAVAVIHAGPSGRPMIERCIKFEFINFAPSYYLFKRDVIKGTEHIYEEQTLLFLNHGFFRVVQGIPAEGSIINIVDYDVNREMVLFIEAKKLYILLSRSKTISDALLSKYQHYSQFNWVMLFVDQSNC